MEISNETKAKVFAQYLGCKVETKHGFTTMFEIGLGGINLTHEYPLYFDGKYEIKLILKPLSEITDEDAIEIDNIVYPHDYDKAGWGKWYVNDLFNRKNNYNEEVIFVYQFLQSKGYDLPQYLLGGKTLFECGLCVYE